MRTQRIFILVAILTFAFFSLAPRSARDPFDGTWKVSFDPQDGNGKHFDDVLTFKAEKLTTEAMTKRGFAPARCEIDTRGQTAATFTADAQSETEGSAKWSGMSTGQDINGTLVWTKKDGSVNTYSYRGQRSQ